MLDKTVGVILAGGAGSRLSPLTAERAKPAVPFGGRYRIIDFTLSNCLHSGLRQVLVLTQYKSHSLLTHLRDGGPFTTLNSGNTSHPFLRRCEPDRPGTRGPPTPSTRTF